MTRATGRGSSSRPPTPRLPRPRGGLEAAVPSGPPRPQAPPTWREARGPPHPQPPHKGGPRRAPARSGHREAPARNAGAGRFQNQPALVGEGEGEGNADPRGRRVAAGDSNPSRQLHSVTPATPRDERPPVGVSQPSPARPRSHSTHPWTPFSLLPPRSLNVRLPLAFPLGAALRRREARNLGRYHRAGPRGGARRFEPGIAGSSVQKPGTQPSLKSQTGRAG